MRITKPPGHPMENAFRINCTAPESGKSQNTTVTIAAIVTAVMPPNTFVLNIHSSIGPTARKVSSRWSYMCVYVATNTSDYGLMAPSRNWNLLPNRDGGRSLLDSQRPKPEHEQDRHPEEQHVERNHVGAKSDRMSKRPGGVVPHDFIDVPEQPHGRPDIAHEAHHPGKRGGQHDQGILGTDRYLAPYRRPQLLRSLQHDGVKEHSDKKA